MKISVVILAYNEEKNIAACLDSIMAQSLTPAEIIVVDNNSKDATAVIAASYPGVRVIKEKNQGITYACRTGFNAAKGDIFARIDADSAASPGWLNAIKQHFENDPEVYGLAGRVAPSELSPAGKFWFSRQARFIRFVSAKTVGVKILMAGHNMAITKKAWQEIADVLHVGDSVVLEDVDISLAIQKIGKLEYENDMLIKTPMVEYFFNWPKLYRYAKVSKHTAKMHGVGEK